MQVRNVKAEANPRGGQIDLSWTNPSVSECPDFAGVKIFRRESSYPELQNIKTTSAAIFDYMIQGQQAGVGETTRFSDTGLKGETVYYYALAAYDNNDPPNYFPVYASAMSTTGYATAEQLYAGLPGIYQRFDTVLPPNASHIEPEDLHKGQLNRLMDMFGVQFDLLRSYASGMQNFFDVDRIDGALLPLLAQWIDWQTDYSLPFIKQRNEIKYAPHFYRTTGIAANLLATLNRITTWNGQIKEFIHNILRSNNPEELTIWEQHRHTNEWEEPQLVTLDSAYEGRPAALLDQQNPQRQWLFYHRRRGVAPNESPGASGLPIEDSFQIWYKLCNYGEWLPAQRVTLNRGCNKHPAVVQRPSDDNFLVFYSDLVEDASGEPIPQIRLNLLAAGRPAQPARIEIVPATPETDTFALAEGDRLDVTLNDGPESYTESVNFHAEDFNDITHATAAEVSALLNRRVPGVDVAPGDAGTLVFTSTASRDGLSIAIAGTAATKLGVLGSSNEGRDALAAQLNLGQGPFVLKHGDTLALMVDGNLPAVITFDRTSFKEITRATPAEMVSVIKSVVPGIAKVEGGNLKLSSQTSGAASSIAIDVNTSTAAEALGLGVPLPPAEPRKADSEPAAFVDNDGGIWLFWSSLRGGRRWKIWYNRFDGTSWGAARPLVGFDQLWTWDESHTDSLLPDLRTPMPGADRVAEREPCVLFEKSGAGKIWLFWSAKRYIADGKRRKGYWNVFFRTTSQLDFDLLTESDWSEHELTPDPAGSYDNQEPSACRFGPHGAELYFSSNRADGLHIWSATITDDKQEKTLQITDGQFTHRAPAVLKDANQVGHLWFRTNQSMTYRSQLYPAAKTIDARYSGSTTFDTRNAAKFSRRGSIDDVMHYTYEADGKNGNQQTERVGRYAGNKIGIYLTPNTDDTAFIIRKQSQIKNLLSSYLPVQVQAILIIQQVIIEVVYPYDDPSADPKSLIQEAVIDTVIGDVYKGLQDEVVDRVSVHWIRTWDASHSETILPDLQVLRPDLLNFQLWTWDQSHRDSLLPDLKAPKSDLSARLYISKVEEASYHDEFYRGPRDERLDGIGSHWLCTWSEAFPDTRLADFQPPHSDLSARLYIKGMEEGQYEGDVYGGLRDEHFDRVNFHWQRTTEPADTLPDLRAEQPNLSARLFLKEVEEGE